MLYLGSLLACDGTSIKTGDGDDTAESFTPPGPDWSLGDEVPEGMGLAACAYPLFQAVREQFSGDAELVSVMGQGDLSGNAELCLAQFVSRSHAGVVATGYYSDGSASVATDSYPDDPFCSNGSVKVATIAETPITEWYVDSTALDAAFAEVTSATLTSFAVVPPVVLPDMNLCYTDGNFHWEVPDADVTAVLVSVVRDCNEDGGACGVVIDAKTGETLDRR